MGHQRSPCWLPRLKIRQLLMKPRQHPTILVPTIKGNILSISKKHSSQRQCIDHQFNRIEHELVFEIDS